MKISTPDGKDFIEIKKGIINNSLIKIHEIFLKISNMELLDIRNNIRYRCNSILFHIEDLVNRLNFIEDKLKKIDLFDHNKRVSILSLTEDTILYIFDDIIFNFVSLIDYIGKLISNLYLKKNKNWNSTHDIIKDLKDFSNNDLKKIILDHHKEWVNYLQEYRGKIFHYDKDIAEVSQIFKWSQNKGMNTEIKVKIPERCKSFLEKVFNKSNKYEIKDNNLTKKDNLDDFNIIEAITIISDMTFYIFQDIINIIHIEYCKKN